MGRSGREPLDHELTIGVEVATQRDRSGRHRVRRIDVCQRVLATTGNPRAPPPTPGALSPATQRGISNCTGGGVTITAVGAMCPGNPAGPATVSRDE